MFRKRALLILLLLSSLAAHATHMSGGEIYWECIGPNQFRISLLVYRDCAGINVDPSYSLVLTSPCGDRTLTVSHNGATELSQLCDVQLPNSTCNGGTLPGIQEYTYTGTITLPPCDSWSISWTNIYRNNAIVNLTNPGTRHMYIESVLNSAEAPCNDSPTFTNTAIPYVCLGYPVTYSYGAVDAEGDSLSYALIGARMIDGTAIPYTNPFTPTQPINGITIDPATGLLNFTLFLAGNWVVVVRVTEYDADGNVIGTIMRDMQFVAYPCANVPPDAATGNVSNLTGAAVQLGPRQIQVCESGDFCFDMVISDVNAGNILEAFSNAAMSLAGATFSYTGTNPITATLCWTASPGSAGFYPLIVNVNDGACPIPAFQTYVYSIEVLPGLAATLDVVDEACLGSGNGTIAAVVTAGTSPFTYAWSTGSSGSMITGGPGDYSVDITDVNGCALSGLSGTIGTAAQPNQADAGDDFRVCAGTGAFALQGNVVNATGGTWSNGNGTFGGAWPTVFYDPSADEVANGRVDLILTSTGNNGCPPAADTVSIRLQNSFAGMVATATDALCNGGNSGTATVAPGDPGLTYLWSDAAAQTTATATQLAAGSYTVTITDLFACDTTLGVTVSQPTAVSLVGITHTDETCFGFNDGTVTAEASGGIAPYIYTWDNGATGPQITVGAGFYEVTITDANGCAPASGTATVSALGLPNAAEAGPDMVACTENAPIYLNEQVTNAPSGTWSGGSGTFNGTYPDIDYTPGAADFAAGSITLTLTTVGNTTCPAASDSMTLLLPSSFIGIDLITTDANCYGTSTGSAAVNINNGFNFLWFPGGQTTQSIEALAAGDYSVLVTDGFGCPVTLNTSIEQPDAITIGNVEANNESCAGVADGTLMAMVSGGTAPYSYTWSNGDTTAILTAAAGTYSVSVTDANGCAPATADGIIVATGLPNIADAGPDAIGCLNALPIALQGSVQNATGGTWSGGAGAILGAGLTVQYQPTNAEIMAGGVDLFLTTTGNATCPPATDTIHVSLSNTFLTAGLSTTDAACSGNVDGSITFSPHVLGNTYSWNDANAQTLPTAIGLGAGPYTVVVTDALGCDTALTALIGEPQPLNVASVATTNVACAGGSNGTVVLSVAGGTPIYGVSWSSGQTTMTITGLGVGTYTASITDAQGCSTEVDATITEPAPILVAVQAPDTVCVNTAVQLSATASGGAGTYTFDWGGFGFNDTVQLAFSATQTMLLSVVDQAGCAGPVTPVTVNVLDLLSADLTAYGDTTVCAGGVATVGSSISGYAGAVTYTWSPFGYAGPGPYSVPITEDQNLVVTVIDACGNSIERTIGLRLDTPPAIQLPPVIAQGCAPLMVQFPTLDLGNVIYTWNLGNDNTTNVPAPQLIYPQGTYTASLTVTTPLGCTASSTGGGLIQAFGAPTAAFTASPWVTNIDEPVVAFDDQSVGTITNYEWLFGDGGTSATMDPSHEYMDLGTFMVELTVEDQNGCTARVTHPVTIEPVYDVVIPTAFTPNPNGPGGPGGGSGGGGGNWVTGDLSNDVFYPFVRFVDEFRMRVFNRWGELIFESTDLSVGWDGYYRGELSPQDVYVVQTWFKFVDGKKVEKLSDLTLFR